MSSVPQERVLAALRGAAAYPHPTGEIRTIRTHISMVFLAGDLAYKVKREVRFPFLDLSTLELRRRCSEEEVRLNRRLSPDLYLGVIPITVDPRGIAIGGSGRTVEYAVQMRRLPQDRMMDSLVREGRLPPDAIDRICDRLVWFHSQAEKDEAVAAFGAPSEIARLWDEHFTESAPLIDEFIHPFQDALLRGTARAWMVRKGDLLERRHQDGHIREGHGDLRCSSICLTEPLQIFDCLEFSRRLRCCDVASDVAFLAMDLRWMRRRDLADELVQRYSAASGDPDLPRLLPFYACYRACVRAKVSALSASDPEASGTDRTRFHLDARGLFAQACEYAREDRPPVLLAVCGLSGTGKSTLAEHLGRVWSAPVLSTDRVRKELHGARPTDRRAAPFGEGLYSADVTHQTYVALADRVEKLLRTGRSVVADGTFSQRWQRELVTDAARRSGALRFFLELTATPEHVQERLAHRQSDAGAVSDANWSIYLAQRSRWEAMSLPEWDHPLLSTEGSAQDVCRQAQRTLLLRLEPDPQELVDVGTKDQPSSAQSS